MVYQLSLRTSSSRVAGAWALRWQQRTVRRIAVDGVFNYASAVLNDGLLLLEFCDAIREGDGKLILRCWRAMLICFQHARHSNYAKEVILLQAAVNATATEHVAAQITWSRVVNTTGRPGSNILICIMNASIVRKETSLRR